jgi:DNA-binding XRE family transcriptional regulator
MVLLEEAEYNRLRTKADEWEPLMPPLSPDGTYPALEALRVSLARKIIRHRRRLGLTQVELARRAGIRPETLNRIERGERSPSVATIDKIDRALKRAEKEEARR